MSVGREIRPGFCDLFSLESDHQMVLLAASWAGSALFQDLPGTRITIRNMDVFLRSASARI